MVKQVQSALLLRKSYWLLFSTLVLVLLSARTASADHTPDPANVTIPGSFQSELGCPGDWQPDCAVTHLTFDSNDDVWQGTFSVPAGSWEYKAALNNAWDENYGAHAAANGANLNFNLSALSDIKFYYNHKSHWVTDNQTSIIATVPGSFQSELGCPGDWDPGCLRSWLQNADGDGLYQFSTDVLPAGDYEAKVAIDESWTENYGAGGVQDGANIAFSVGTNQSVTFVYDPTTHVLVIETGGLEPGDQALVRPVLQQPVEDEILYFVIPDRFNDGSDANDCGDFAGTCDVNDTQQDVLAHGFLPSNKGYYHGGDLQGLQAKLDYLADMGVTAIWVGPIFENKPVQPDSSSLYGRSAGYHGYWITNYMRVDPHLGTNQDFTNLVQAAHARGIQVFMDIVTNHTADVIAYQEGVSIYRNKDDFPYQDANGNIFDDRDYAGQSSFPPMDAATSFPYTPIYPNPGDETTKTPAWLNDRTLYHNRGDSQFSGENSLYGDFFGLDDLFTEHPEVVAGMIDIYRYWIEEFGVDGFRIDTTKHVNIEFWQEFGPAILEAAADAGIDHFFAFGEVFDQQFGPLFLSYFTTHGKLQSAIDFRFQMAARDYASVGTNSDDLRDFFAQDDYFTDADSNAYAMPTFLGNHDMGRIGYFLQRVDQTGADDAELLARSKLAHALMFFARGQPVIYYGDEQGFVGDGGDKDAREDMFANLVDVYADNDLIGTDATSDQDNFDISHPLYQALTSYAQFYHENVALRRGAQIHRYSTGAPGIYAFSRIERSEKIEYLVAFNNAEQEEQAALPTYYGAGVLFDLIGSDGNGGPASSLTTGDDGTLTVNVPPLGFVIYRASQPIPASTAAPAIHIANLASGQTVDLNVQEMDGHQVIERLEVQAELDAAIFAEVTFAVSVDGGPSTPIGTDDNPPYRVFYDVTDLPTGATLDFKAIVHDLSGDGAEHYNAAKVTGIVPVVTEPTPPAGAVPYAVIHYFRPDGDYGDPNTGDFADFWGLHLWGAAIAGSEVTDWTSPKPFLGEDDYGRFAWIALQDTAPDVNFIVHRGDIKDGTNADRAFNPGRDGPEIWLKADDSNFYTSQAAAQGYVTIHYRRPGGDYGDYNSSNSADFWGLHLWGDAIDPAAATEWTTPRKPDGFDDFGAFFHIPVVGVTQPVNFIVHKGDEKDPPDSPDRSFMPEETAAIWLISGDVVVYPQRGAAEDFAVIHYHRADGDYGDPTSDDFNDFWGLHVWEGAATPTANWQQPERWERQDGFGPVFRVPLVDGADRLAYIIHRGDTKDPGPDQFLLFDKWGYEVWQLEGAGPNPEEPHYVLPIVKNGGANPGDIGRQSAYWVDERTIAWQVAGHADFSYRLYYAPEGGLEATATGITGGDSIALVPGTLSDAVKAKFPHLASLPALQLPDEALAMVPAILKGQLAVSAVDGDGNSVDATGLQIPGVLDDLYTYDGLLGVTFEGDVPTLRLWAPTARAVTLHRFADATPDSVSTTLPMTLNPATGVWSITGEPAWKGQFYLYEVEVYVHATGQVEHNLVTDPYSFSLSLNSTRSQIVNLSDPTLLPAGWNSLVKPPLAAPEDIVIYELHLRDFSANDATVPEAYRGTYKAFTLAGADGMQHLAALADAGLTHVHLLPVFDIASINEDKSAWQQPDPALLATYPPDSTEQQQAVMAIADVDGFNWGYDPLHYTVPEGSYSTDPDGTPRIVEFREMVQALNQTGLRVVMDVVYNHTVGSGQDPKSVLDRIVPGYYHRLNVDGTVATSTCCQNTATEHTMMEKLMIDSVLTWAKQYKVDGFRFDLMGHHSKANMLKLRAALDGLTLAQDGVDGSSIYLYGEGWNFGEVVDNARFEQATQLNLGGTGIGTFNDRLRDGVRGGGPFDGGEDLIKNQGFINGLYYDPNELVLAQVPEEARRAELLLSADQIRVGLAGNLADFSFQDRNGNLVTGAQIDYNGAPAGYTQDPQEQIAYVEAHDNETLYDISQYKHRRDLSMAERVAAQNLGMDFVLLAQGVPFLHAGIDMLRSKSLDRNSYNSGDWFNRLDFTYQSNNWGAGLPPEGNNGDNWPLMASLLADPALRPAPADILQSISHLRTMLGVRKSSPLFRLPTEQEVMARLTFYDTGPNQLPGLIVMALSDQVAPDLDPWYESVVVLFNANDMTQTLTVDALRGRTLLLHPLLSVATDGAYALAAYANGSFTVPPRTTAIFVEPEPVEVLIQHLSAQVDALEAAQALNSGQAHSIRTHLQNVLKKVQRNQPTQACNMLSAFVNHIQSLVYSRVLTPEQGQPLIDAANRIIYLLCGVSSATASMLGTESDPVQADPTLFLPIVAGQ